MTINFKKVESLFSSTPISSWNRIIGTVFFILLLVGCSDEVVKEGDFPPSLTGLVIIEGIEYRMEEGNYNWERKTGLGTEVVLTDHASPYQMSSHIEPINVNPSQKMTIQIEDNPDIIVYLWNESGREREIELTANQLTLPSKDGKYIFEVLAEWPNGTVSYTFVADIQPHN